MLNNVLWMMITFILGLILGFVIAWYYGQHRWRGPKVSGNLDKPAHQPTIGNPRKQPAVRRAKLQDLCLIEGIDPELSSVLIQSGIKTIPQLAFADQEQLARTIQQAGVQNADPQVLMEQAILATAGEWDRLTNLQNRLKDRDLAV